jgi:hypothetical protein
MNSVPRTMLVPCLATTLEWSLRLWPHGEWRLPLEQRDIDFLAAVEQGLAYMHFHYVAGDAGLSGDVVLFQQLELIQDKDLAAFVREPVDLLTQKRPAAAIVKKGIGYRASAWLPECPATVVTVNTCSHSGLRALGSARLTTAVTSGA